MLGAVVLPVAQGIENDTAASVYLQISAALPQAAVLALGANQAGPTAVMAYLGLLFGVIEALELLNGFGAPDTGGVFRAGHTTFSAEITDLLKQATPDSADWAGASADAYLLGDTAQQARVQRVAEADWLLAQGLKTQAAKIEQAREVLAVSRLAITAAIGVVSAFRISWLLYVSQGPVGQAVAAVIANVAAEYGNRFAVCALLSDLVTIVDLIVEGASTEDAVNAIAASYRGVVDEVDAGIPVGAMTVPPQYRVSAMI